jgi:hypothetical protein
MLNFLIGINLFLYRFFGGFPKRFTNYIIGKTNLRIHTQNGVDKRRFVSLCIIIKYINNSLQIIKITYIIQNVLFQFKT